MFYFNPYLILICFLDPKKSATTSMTRLTRPRSVILIVIFQTNYNQANSVLEITMSMWELIMETVEGLQLRGMVGLTVKDVETLTIAERFLENLIHGRTKYGMATLFQIDQATFICRQ